MFGFSENLEKSKPLLQEIIMKKFVFIVLSVIASAAMAGVSSTADTKLEISGTSVQTALITTSTVSNTSSGDMSEAQQNIASNVGNINISNNSIQSVDIQDANVSNQSTGGKSSAQQSLSSNVGNVVIIGDSNQLTLVANSAMSNTAGGYNSLAIQNVASNSSK